MNRENIGKGGRSWEARAVTEGKKKHKMGRRGRKQDDAEE